MPQPPKDKSQIDRFKEAARQLEVDESEAAFDEKLKKLAQPPGGNATLKNPPESQ
ncbi:hypothetical protein [Acidocella facilis]|uniref:hypothetical protein n=1 Tax=Acidocella facilis TaxID=525 RepID=UPI00146FB3F4|nr:hypothetical protein [Acidocella facilis]